MFLEGRNDGAMLPLEAYELLPENAHLQSGVVIAADWIGFLCLAGFHPGLPRDDWGLQRDT